MNRYLVQTANPGAYDPEDYRHVEQTGTIDGDAVLILLHPTDPTKPGDSLIGGWDLANAPVEPIDLVKFAGVRPFGNAKARIEYDGEGNPTGETRAGLGTKHLLYQDFDIPGQRQLTAEGRLYPDDQAPFFVECRLIYDAVHDYSPRFEVQMEGQDLPRDPSLRNFRIFSSPDCIYPDEHLYQLGALQVGDSLWHFDESGDPLQVWFSVSNRYTQARDAVHFALYWSEAEEGRFTLPAGADFVRCLLWEKNQGTVPAEGEWQDSGGTILNQFGTIYQVDAAIVAQLIIDETLTVGGNEMVFTGVRVGFTDQIYLDPVINGLVGEAIYWYR